MFLPLADLATIFAVSTVCSVVICGVAIGGLKLVKRRSLTVKLVIIVGTTLASVLAGMIAVSAAMYLSQHDLYVFFAVAGSSVLSSLAVALVLGRVIATDLQGLRRLAADIGLGQRIDLPQDPKDTSETARLRAELLATSNRLADARDEVAALDASRRELVAWIAHDLRTPMAGLKAMAEALEDGVVDDPSRYFGNIRSQVDKLSRLVDDLFALSQIQSGSLSLERVDVSLYDLASDTVADLQPIAAAKRVRVEARGNPAVVVSGDPKELTRAVTNLLVNALQHSPDHGEVIVETSYIAHDQAVLTVSDSGNGIPEDSLSRIFDAGWRANNSRTPAHPDDDVLTGGAGFGLAIVRGIVEAHTGTVSAMNTQFGARFEVRLPVSE